LQVEVRIGSPMRFSADVEPEEIAAELKRAVEKL
jgi:hypothetical protein